MKFIISPWRREFINIIEDAQEKLFISSPFIDHEGIKIISNKVTDSKHIEVSIITNLTIGNIKTKGIYPDALLNLFNKFKKVNISSLGRLHAKVYIIDDKKAVITSANLTKNGLINNFEYGILLTNKNEVEEIREDMKKYFSLGNIFFQSTIEKLSEHTNKLWLLQSSIERKIKQLETNTKIKNIMYKLETELLKNRIKDGKTINSIFADTILYLLKKKGPLSTKELHPLIQTIHPDICDDSIDRVIDGQHFGKKWKHLVRNAQQYLKRKDLIELRNNKWYLTSNL